MEVLLHQRDAPSRKHADGELRGESWQRDKYELPARELLDGFWRRLLRWGARLDLVLPHRRDEEYWRESDVGVPERQQGPVLVGQIRPDGWVGVSRALGVYYYSLTCWKSPKIGRSMYSCRSHPSILRDVLVASSEPSCLALLGSRFIQIYAHRKTHGMDLSVSILNRRMLVPALEPCRFQCSIVGLVGWLVGWYSMGNSLLHLFGREE